MKKTKQGILHEIKNCLDKGECNKGVNSMGVSESFYNPYYLTAKCFTTKELSEMKESELQNIIKLAEYASYVFY